MSISLIDQTSAFLDDTIEIRKINENASTDGEVTLSLDRADASSAIAKWMKAIHADKVHEQLNAAEEAVRNLNQVLKPALSILVNFTGENAAETWPVLKQLKALNAARDVADAQLKVRSHLDVLANLAGAYGYADKMTETLTDVKKSTDDLDPASPMKHK